MRDNSYSRLVAWLKVLLPLGALAILSTMFLVARTIDPSQAIPFAQIDVNELAREQRITAPHYTSVTADGTAISVSADSAKPDPGIAGRAAATGLKARIETPEGGTADLAAAQGQVDTGADRVVFEGAVTIDTATGWHLTAPRLTSALQQTDVTADGPVTGTGPAGTLEAGGLRLTSGDRQDSSYVLVFSGGVKLVYDPVPKEP